MRAQTRTIDRVFNDHWPWTARWSITTLSRQFAFGRARTTGNSILGQNIMKQPSKWRWVRRTLGIALVALIAVAIQVIFFRPFSLNVFYYKTFASFALNSPQLLSTEFGIGFYNDELDDNSRAAEERDIALLRKAHAQLLQYDRPEEASDALSYDILADFLSSQIEGLEYDQYGYSITQRGGHYSGVIDFMSSQHDIEDAGDAEDYLSRVSQIPRVIDNEILSVRHEQSLGTVPPTFIIDKILDNLGNIITDEVADHPLVIDFTTKVNALEDLSADEKDDLIDQMLTLTRSDVNPAYQRLVSTIEALRESSTTDAGVWKFPRGEDYYQHRIRAMTTTDYTADQLHTIGLSEVDRILDEMQATLNAEGYTGMTVAEGMAALNLEDRFLYPDTDEGRAQILADYQSIIDEINAGIDQAFDIRPSTGVEVRRTPEYRQKTAAGGSYRGPSQDGSRPGIFYANLYDITATPKFGMRTLAYHEAVPGHHFQIAIKTELEGLPIFRSFIGFTAFSEGWALYAEQLAWEMGFQEDPYDNLGRLQAELMRAVRLVVDTGIHHKRWTREQAIEYFASTTGQAMSDVESEIERYIVWPGQALAYKVGMLKILELRDKAEQALGDRYDIRDFHNVVLTSGGVPMSLLEQLVDDYIARTLQGETS